MTYRFSRRARTELFNAVDYYESKKAGLGAEFADAVSEAISKILETPNRWPELDPGTRRFRLDRFPYAIVYRAVNENLVDVLAVFHQHRRPENWRRK